MKAIRIAHFVLDMVIPKFMRVDRHQNDDRISNFAQHTRAKDMARRKRKKSIFF